MCYTNAISWQICTILVRLSEVVQIRHLVRYVQIAERSGWTYCLNWINTKNKIRRLGIGLWRVVSTYMTCYETCMIMFNKVIIFVFFVHKKYFSSIVKLQLNHWCHVDYFNSTFLGLGTFQLHCSLWRDRKLSDFIENILCSDRRSYRFGTTWWWVINDINTIFGVT